MNTRTILNALDRAVNGPVAKGSMPTTINPAVIKSLSERNGNDATRRSKYGPTKAAFKAIYSDPRVKSAISKTAEKELRRIQAEQERVHAEMMKAATTGPAGVAHRHLQTEGAKIVKGEDSGCSTQEAIAQRETKIHACKVALHDLSANVRQLCRPAWEAGLEVCTELINAEFDGERQRFEKFGIPYEGPSEVILTLHECHAHLRARLSTPSVISNTAWEPVANTTNGLIDFES